MDFTLGTVFSAVFFNLGFSTHHKGPWPLPLTLCFLFFSYSISGVEQDLKDLSPSFKFPHGREECSNSQQPQTPNPRPLSSQMLFPESTYLSSSLDSDLNTK